MSLILWGLDAFWFARVSFYHWPGGSERGDAPATPPNARVPPLQRRVAAARAYQITQYVNTSAAAVPTEEVVEIRKASVVQKHPNSSRVAALGPDGHAPRGTVRSVPRV